MREQNLEGTAEETARLLGPRAVPNARFTRMLREDIYHAAYQKMGRPSTTTLQGMVVELRKLVRLLRKTLVPVCPPQRFHIWIMPYRHKAGISIYLHLPPHRHCPRF